MEDNYFNPGGKEKNRQAKINWFNKWKQKFQTLILKIEKFLESEINIAEEKQYNWNVNININENHWNVAWINNWSQNINNQIDEIIKILDKKDIQQKDEIKKLLEEYKKTGNEDNLIKGFSILGSVSSAWSLVAGILWLLG